MSTTLRISDRGVSTEGISFATGAMFARVQARATAATPPSRCRPPAEAACDGCASSVARERLRRQMAAVSIVVKGGAP